MNQASERNMMIVNELLETCRLVYQLLDLVHQINFVHSCSEFISISLDPLVKFHAFVDMDCIRYVTVFKYCANTRKLPALFLNNFFKLCFQCANHVVLISFVVQAQNCNSMSRSPLCKFRLSS